VVDDDKVECPNAAFTRIQDAVDAASPGDEIHICKGVYVEQVKITKPLDIDADNVPSSCPPRCRRTQPVCLMARDRYGVAGLRCDWRFHLWSYRGWREQWHFGMRARPHWHFVSERVRGKSIA